MDTNMENPQNMEMREPAKTNSVSRWLKKVGIAGFIFFLVKGIVWLMLGYLLWE